MFAFGRRFQDKRRFVMMLSVILWHTLLQVQSGSCYALHKHTHTHTHTHSRTDRNAHGIRPLSRNLSDSLSFYLPSTFLPLFVSLPFSHTHSPCSVSSFSFPFPGHWPVFGSEADGSLGSSGFVTLKQHGQTQLEGAEIRLAIQKLLDPISDSPDENLNLHPLRFLSRHLWAPHFQLLQWRCSEGQHGRWLLQHVKVCRSECVHLYEVNQDVWSSPSRWIKVEKEKMKKKQKNWTLVYVSASCIQLHATESTKNLFWACKWICKVNLDII